MNLDDPDAEFEEMERRLRQLKENFDIDAQENDLYDHDGWIKIPDRESAKLDLWAERKLDEIVRRR
jgi:hypothetical protein